MITKKHTVINLTENLNDPILISFNEPSAFEVQEANIVPSTPNFIELSYEEFKRRITSDHVSKSELRAWCEGVMPKLRDDETKADTECCLLLQEILEKFCKGDK